MFDVDVRIPDLPAFNEALSDLQQSQVPFAIVVALTRTAWNIVPAEQATMHSVFRDPVPWTTDSLQVQQATKQRPVARVGYKEGRTSAGFYLMVQVEGGPRRHTMFEGALRAVGILPAGWYAVPLDGAERDGAGNLSPGQISKILSDVKANQYALRSQNWRQRSGARVETYFAASQNVPGTEHLKPGIYYRISGRNIVPTFAFTPKRPNYRAIFPFDQVAADVVQAMFEPNFWQALDDAVRSSNHSGKWSK